VGGRELDYSGGGYRSKNWRVMATGRGVGVDW